MQINFINSPGGLVTNQISDTDLNIVSSFDPHVPFDLQVHTHINFRAAMIDTDIVNPMHFVMTHCRVSNLTSKIFIRSTS